MAADTYREAATKIAIAEAAKNVREQGWNRGPRVEAYQRADGLRLDPDTGYPWCSSFVVWCFENAGRPLVELHESASVGWLLKYAGDHKWRVGTPQRGDLVCFYWGGPGDSWPDHVGIVTQVLPDGRLKTVEGNTSSDDAGSQDEGDGVFVKTRDPKRYTTAYIRVPGDTKTDRHDYEVIRGKPGNERVIAVADTAGQAGKILERELTKNGAWNIRVRKRAEAS